MPRPSGPPRPEQPTGRSAVVLGATGAVGGQLVSSLIGSDDFVRVTTLGRRPLEIPARATGKLSQHVVDVSRPSLYEGLLAGHTHAFCTLGLGQPSKVDREEFHRVDVEWVEGFAAACKRQGVTHFSLLTAVGANPRSRSYYLRCKGEIEEKVRSLGFARTSFFRPSLLVTPENRYGFTQGVLLFLFPALDWLLVGGLDKYRGIEVHRLGRAMANNAVREGGGVETLHWRDFMASLDKA